jgi:hypothetical protein
LDAKPFPEAKMKDIDENRIPKDDQTLFVMSHTTQDVTISPNKSGRAGRSQEKLEKSLNKGCPCLKGTLFLFDVLTPQCIDTGWRFRKLNH